MDFDHVDVRPVVNEDRLSSLPDEIIHQILSRLDSKYVVRTCSLSSRWKFVWSSMPYLNFSSDHSRNLPKFSKFVTNFLSNRNHQIEVTSLKLDFHGAASQFFVRKIVDYVIAHNIQELDVVINPKRNHAFPSRLFSSQSLKRFYFRSIGLSPYLIPNTPWDFPALTTLSLQEVTFREDNTDKYVDLFSKCVNLTNLKLHRFKAYDVEVFDIITPQLTNLTITSSDFQTINLVAPQLEDLTVINCSIEKLNPPPGISSLCYSGGHPMQLSEDGFHSLEKATIHLCIYRARKPYEEEVAREAINMLHEVHSARYLRLNLDVVECISSFPELISNLPSPFRNLICVKIDTFMRKDAYKAKISDEAKNFLLENTPSATFIMDIPEPPPPKPMKPREGWGKRKARLFAEIENHVTEMQTWLELAKSHSGTKNRVNTVFGNLMAQLKQAEMQVHQRNVERGKLPIVEGRHKTRFNERKLRARVNACLEEMWTMVNQERDEVLELPSKRSLIISLLAKLPKGQRAEIEPRYSRLLQESKPEMDHLFKEHVAATRMVEANEKILAYRIKNFLDFSGSNIPPASQPSSSSSSSLAAIPTPSTSNANPMP